MVHGVGKGEGASPLKCRWCRVNGTRCWRRKWPLDMDGWMDGFAVKMIS